MVGDGYLGGDTYLVLLDVVAGESVPRSEERDPPTGDEATDTNRRDSATGHGVAEGIQIAIDIDPACTAPNGRRGFIPRQRHRLHETQVDGDAIIDISSRIALWRVATAADRKCTLVLGQDPDRERHILRLQRIEIASWRLTGDYGPVGVAGCLVRERLRIRNLPGGDETEDGALRNVPISSQFPLCGIECRLHKTASCCIRPEQQTSRSTPHGRP